MNAIATQEESNNPFKSQQVATRGTNNAVADAGQQREIAEVQAAMVIAKRFPRNQVEAMDRILNACTRTTLADKALYSYSRGGTEITGPSIRLAEVAAQAWGNLSFGIRELEQRAGASTVEAFAWDMETNTRQVKVFQVEHKRHTKGGGYVLTDPRDIYELVANQGARRLRSCILGVIPGDIIEAAVKECEKTLKANVDISAEALKRMVDAFGEFAVSQKQIEKRIQCRLEAIRPAQMVQLKKVYASLRDDMSKPADWFEEIEGEDKPAATLREVVIGKSKPKDAPAEPGADDADGKAEPEKKPAVTKADVKAAIANASNAVKLKQAVALIKQLPENEQEELHGLAVSMAGKFS